MRKDSGLKRLLHETGTRAAVFFPSRTRPQGRQVWAEPRSKLGWPSSLAVSSWPWAAGSQGGKGAASLGHCGENREIRPEDRQEDRWGETSCWPAFSWGRAARGHTATGPHPLREKRPLGLTHCRLTRVSGASGHRAIFREGWAQQQIPQCWLVSSFVIINLQDQGLCWDTQSRLRCVSGGNRDKTRRGPLLGGTVGSGSTGHPGEGMLRGLLRSWGRVDVALSCSLA